MGKNLPLCICTQTHLVQDLDRNRKNGKTSKAMEFSSGEFKLDVPQDRNGNFEFI